MTKDEFVDGVREAVEDTDSYKNFTDDEIVEAIYDGVNDLFNRWSYGLNGG